MNVPCSRIGRTFSVIHHHCNNQLGILSHIASSECNLSRNLRVAAWSEWKQPVLVVRQSCLDQWCVLQGVSPSTDADLAGMAIAQVAGS